MSGSHPTQRSDEQWQDWLDGELPEEQHDALAAALADDATAQRAVDQYQAHRLLGLVHADDAERFVRATVRGLPASGMKFSDEVMTHIDRLRPRPRWPQYVGWAAAALLLIAVGTGTWLTLQPPPAPIATLVTSQDAHWSGAHPMDGARLRPGNYQLTDGRVLIHGDGGAQIAVTAPARFALHTPERVSVLTGTIALRLDPDSHGFTIATAVGDIVDRGTEFVVRIADQGTEVHVIAGSVACVRTGTPTTDLVAGQALRLRSITDAGEAIPLGALDFDNVLPDTISETAAAGLTAYDGFAYRPHDDTLRDGGTGWSGAWQRGVPGLDAEPLTMLAQGLSPTGQPVSGRALDLSGVRQNTLKRTLIEPLATGRIGAHYVSFLYRLDQPAAERSAQAEDTLRVALVSNDDGERVGLGLRDVHPYLVGVSEVSPFTVETGKLYRVVLRLTATNDGREESAVLISPAGTSPTSEPTTWTIIGALQRRSAALVRLEIGFAAGSRAVLDEVRLGTTWTTGVGIPPQP
ncbi:MAG TPA: FecR domain-containing protein [Planctomycetota bacterium]|jgi:hypothetical protein|nr:FecR domain-containing protein [Planctomycetota bacterium]